MKKMAPKLIVLISLLFFFLLLNQASTSEIPCGEPPERLYLLRHTERVDNTSTSPLSEAGHLRAKLLVDAIGHDSIQAIYATDSIRTFETATPLATHKGIKSHFPLRK